MIRKYGSKDYAASLSGVDQRLRDCLQVLWLSLPKERANLDDLEEQFRRLVERVLRDFKEDAEQFKENGESPKQDAEGLF
ncbi:hypothetical protein [uncultured Porticoccus sp.]|uniref:hypothetical protein n=1 Tax=uncultured Porticoccus sp. TaxID=1256050 RepID=UPI0030DB501A|tara:strand:- start:5050 stop:5289 length:240 start_codon:yes stop_codon:yes gene_type:complete